MISFVLDKVIGDLRLDPAMKPEEKTDIIWETKYRLGDHDWQLLKTEFVNWVGPWTYLSLGEFAIIFVIALVSLISSNFDIWSDGQLSYTYFFGSIYEFYFTNKSHPMIGNLNCLAKDISVVGNTTFYIYDCFKTERLLGVLTIIPVFLPGALLSCLLARGLRNSKHTIYSIICLALTPLICAIFPLLVLVTKVITYINR